MGVLKIGVVMDPIDKIDVAKDTTFVLMLEAERRKHELHYMELGDLSICGATPEGRYRRVNVARAAPHYRFGESATGPLADFDVMLMRKDPPFDMNFFFATHLLSMIDEKKCLVVNRPLGLREANEKLYALNFSSLIPETLVSGDMDQLRRFMNEIGGEMIVKPLDGYGGSGVFYLHRKTETSTHCWKRRRRTAEIPSWRSVTSRRCVRATSGSSCSTASRSARCCASRAKMKPAAISTSGARR